MHTPLLSPRAKHARVLSPTCAASRLRLLARAKFSLTRASAPDWSLFTARAQPYVVACGRCTVKRCQSVRVETDCLNQPDTRTRRSIANMSSRDRRRGVDERTGRPSRAEPGRSRQHAAHGKGTLLLLFAVVLLACVVSATGACCSSPELRGTKTLGAVCGPFSVDFPQFAGAPTSSHAHAFNFSTTATALAGDVGSDAVPWTVSNATADGLASIQTGADAVGCTSAT